MRLNYLANATGLAMKYMGIFIFVPVCVALYYKEFSSILPFATAGLISVILGFLLGIFIPDASKVESMNDINKSEALFIVAVSWIVFS